MANYQSTNAKVRQDGSRFYLSFGATRSKRDFATIKGAMRHAEASGVTVDTDDLPNPNAKSVAHKISVTRSDAKGNILGLMLIENGQVKVIADTVEALNPILKRLGYKPVRITRNTITGTGRPLIIDEDTPLCCDPGSETYHSM